MSTRLPTALNGPPISVDVIQAPERRRALRPLSIIRSARSCSRLLSHLVRVMQGPDVHAHGGWNAGRFVSRRDSAVDLAQFVTCRQRRVADTEEVVGRWNCQSRRVRSHQIRLVPTSGTCGAENGLTLRLLRRSPQLASEALPGERAHHVLPRNERRVLQPAVIVYRRAAGCRDLFQDHRSVEI